jgi:hypothetical protein
VGLAPGGCRLAGANLLSNGPSNLQGVSDGKTALQSGKHGGSRGSRLPRISEDSDRSLRSYYGRVVVATAWREAWSFSKAQLIAGAVAGVVAVLIAVAAGDLPGDVGSALIYPLAGVGAVWLIFFLSRLVVAPAATLNEVTRARNAAQKAHAEAVEATEAARAEGERRLGKARDESARQLADAREDGERRVREAVAEGDRRVAGVQEQLDTALARIEELEAEEDPDPRIALANRAARLAAELRALCAKWEGRISGGGIRASGDERAATANSDFLEEYQRDHSIETRAIFDQLASKFRNIDPAKRGLVENPRFSRDLLEVESLFSAAAKQLRERAEADPIEVDRVQLARDAYKGQRHPIRERLHRRRADYGGGVSRRTAA